MREQQSRRRHYFSGKQALMSKILRRASISGLSDDQADIRRRPHASIRQFSSRRNSRASVDANPFGRRRNPTDFWVVRRSAARDGDLTAQEKRFCQPECKTPP
jgi:hypothetical protein